MADFQDIFGSEMKMFETKFLRYMEEVQAAAAFAPSFSLTVAGEGRGEVSVGGVFAVFSSAVRCDSSFFLGNERVGMIYRGNPAPIG